jgi:hypothetical protein
VFADCVETDDILHRVLEVDSDEFFEVFQMSFLMSTQMSTLKLIPHEPCWLLSGVSRCEGLDHVTVTVTSKY